MAVPPSAGNPVNVGPYKRIIGFHWPDSSDGPAPNELFFMSLPQISQWRESPITPFYGSDGVIVEVEEFQYIFRAEGTGYSNLLNGNRHAYCQASGGNAEIIGTGVIPYRFFEATDGATESGYRYQQAPSPAIYYDAVTIGMDTYEYGNIFDPDPAYRLIGQVSVDLSALQLTELVVGGRIFTPLGFHDLTFLSGSLSDGKYLVLTTPDISA